MARLLQGTSLSSLVSVTPYSTARTHSGRLLSALGNPFLPLALSCATTRLKDSVPEPTMLAKETTAAVSFTGGEVSWSHRP